VPTDGRSVGRGLETKRESLASVTVDVSVVIGSDEQRIFDCLRSLYASKPACDCRVHVVDNGASAETIARLQQRFSDVEIVRNARRLGFAANHNQVMTSAAGEYVLILNDDTILLGPVLDTLACFLERNPAAGAVGCRILNPDGSLQPSTYGEPSLLKILVRLSGLRVWLPDTKTARRLACSWLRRLFPRALATYWGHDQLCEAESVKGACFMVRRSMVDRVGGMDEAGLAYGEEIEWQMRMRRAGWKVFFVPNVAVIHYGRRRIPFWPDRLLVEHVKSLLSIFRKHRSPAQLFLLRVAIAWLFIVRMPICYSAAAFSAAFRTHLQACRDIAGLALGFPGPTERR